jgi:hypothetical protein
MAKDKQYFPEMKTLVFTLSGVNFGDNPPFFDIVNGFLIDAVAAW